ncbi:hypothetical protein [Nibricoccus sp. IMCC34717]|uniref:hypothetical protein n=1 Tax=Nibricoccus sp. IMCC34717 TaxID=3034021 RepID=UPI00384B0A51
MSAEVPATESSPRWFPKWFLGGFAAGLVLAVALVYHFRQHGFHGQFHRFHPLASPESLYLPTIDEMRGIVRDRYREGQVLVLVGGNSIFYGVGQPLEKLWTKRLQEELGDRYCVINFALRGGPLASGAGVISEVMRDEFPKQILVANVSPLQAQSPTGEPAYQYLTQSAWDRGLLAEIPAREEFFQKMWAGHRFSATRAYNIADGVLGFRVLGNALTWNVVSLYPFPMEPRFPEWMKPRGSIADYEPDIDQVPVKTRYVPEALQAEMEIVRAMSTTVIEHGPDGAWRPRPPPTPKLEPDFVDLATMLRPDSLKPKTLVVTSVNSPYYRDRLTPDERERDDAVIRMSVEAWERAGYAAMDYSTGFTAADYVDRTHLAGTGGAKLASLVAAKIRKLSKELKYE